MTEIYECHLEFDLIYDINEKVRTLIALSVFQYKYFHIRQLYMNICIICSHNDVFLQ